MKILIVGDIFSKMGRASFERNLKKLKEEHKIVSDLSKRVEELENQIKREVENN